MSYVIEVPKTVSLPVEGEAATFPVRRIYCVGRNYADHAREMGHDPDREPPFFFQKPTDAVVPNNQTIPFPVGTKDLHHEIELVVAIGIGGRNIKAADAVRHIWGYAIGLDMTRRDLQNDMKKQGRPWSIGKAFDESAPIGPLHAIARTGELKRGAISLSVNGVQRQSGDLSELIWNVAEIVSEASKLWTLAPGDLIYTGTPEGVGPLVRGDLVEGEVEGVGKLAFRIV